MFLKSPYRALIIPGFHFNTSQNIILLYMKFVDIKNDIAFRKIFGNKNRKEVLISFLNAVLLLDADKKIIDVDILTPYQLPDLKGEGLPL